MSRQARVGILVLAGVALFILALFALANRTFLFSDTFYVKSQFTRVAGLVPGAAVQYQGVNVGRVESVQLPEAPGKKIVVTMAISEKARHLVRHNTQAQIKSDGLVGNQIVVLVPSAEIGEPVGEEDFIPGVDPFDLFEITDKALASVQRFESAAVAFEQIMRDVQEGQGTLGKFIYDPALYDGFVATTDETRRVLNNLANNAEALVGLAGEATRGVQDILDKVDRGEGTLARMLNDPAVYNSLLATADTLQAIAGDLRAVTQNAENMTNWGALGAFRFAELMEAGKHNWLFKRYFEERGTMDLAPFELRERALAESERRLQEREQALFEWEQRLRALAAKLEAAAASATDGSKQ
ncbi:MAG: MCE family protein [Bacteroidetes bacterium]|nr:MAG: MCE family protein [Bacteroidota bacterium]